MMTVTVCVGSSCHLKGARSVIERFSELLTRHELAGRVELKGAFCMDCCGGGINWQVDDQPVSSANEEEAVATFCQRVLAPLGVEVPEEQEDKDPA